MSPLWSQVCHALRDRIARSDPASDGWLPTEMALCDEFGVSRITVRRALEELRADGLVVAGRGRGWRVAGFEDRHPLGAFHITTGTDGDPVEVTVETVAFDVVPAGSSLLVGGRRVLRVLRLARAGGTPIDLVEIHIGGPYAKAISRSEIDTVPPARLLAHKGCALGRTDQHARADLAGPDDALLEIEVGAPVLVVDRRVFEGERVVLHTLHRHPGALARVDVTFPRTDATSGAPVRIVAGDRDG